MSAHLDEPYFEWLYSQVATVKQKNPSRTYWKLFRILYSKAFVWSVSNDDNRAYDGMALRYEWLELGISQPIDTAWLEMDCSFLELLIGLSRRAAFITSEDSIKWFWLMIGNLYLDQYNDLCLMDPTTKVEIDHILDRVIQRTYSKSGRGGLFPLSRRSWKDQTEVELWYQLHSYIEERGISY